MREISISDFRKNGSQLIKQAARTKTTLRITLRGRLIAEVVPFQNRKRFILGGMAGTGEILGDIVSPVIAVDEFSTDTTRK